MIDEWLKKFNKGWTEKNVDAVMDLFAEDFEYWETPFVKFDTKSELRKEWMVVKEQSDIKLETQLVSDDKETRTVKWSLEYNNGSGMLQFWSGLYLIVINNRGLCTYFYQVGEKK